jgi:hypothetical protein
MHTAPEAKAPSGRSIDGSLENVYNAPQIYTELPPPAQRKRAMRQSRPLQVKTIRGTPFTAHRRTFTPVARVISGVHRRATIHADRVEGSGWGFARTQPIALVEEHDGTSHTHPIPDRTRTVLGQMALVALVFPVLCAAVIAVADWLRDLD